MLNSVSPEVGSSCSFLLLLGCLELAAHMCISGSARDGSRACVQNVGPPFSGPLLWDVQPFSICGHAELSLLVFQVSEMGAFLSEL